MGHPCMWVKDLEEIPGLLDVQLTVGVAVLLSYVPAVEGVIMYFCRERSLFFVYWSYFMIYYGI